MTVLQSSPHHSQFQMRKLKYTDIQLLQNITQQISGPLFYRVKNVYSLEGVDSIKSHKVLICIEQS